MSYLLPFLAIVFGYLIGKFFIEKEQWVSYLLAFSGAFLLSITLFEMLPHVFLDPSDHTGAFIMIGILLQLILDYFSKGAEHGHVHLHENKNQFPLLLFLSLSVHAFVEGFPVSMNEHVLWGVVLHKIPIAIILSIYFIKAKLKSFYILLFLFLFALMTPLGSYAAVHFDWTHERLNAINAVAIGVFLHVSTTILFESSKNHRFNFTKLVTILLGVAIAYFI